MVPILQYFEDYFKFKDQKQMDRILPRINIVTGILISNVNSDKPVIENYL